VVTHNALEVSNINTTNDRGVYMFGNMSYVQGRIAKAKIQKLQLDLFGFCYAKCWYCPVKYIPQPEEGMIHMPLETVDKIFSELYNDREVNGKDSFVSRDFGLFLTTHYSEILLYRHFEGLLELARKYRGLLTFILSNGVNLTKEKVDIIKEYRDIVVHIGLNIPAFEKELWAKRAGFPEKRFDDLMANLEYAQQELSYMGESLQIHVNGLSHADFNGYMTKGPKFEEMGYDLDGDEHEKQFQLAKTMFPGFTVTKSGLMDRTGLLADYISNQEFQERRLENRTVVGCGNWGDRTTEWLHVNAAGDVILCCNDYKFDYKFGNVNTQSIREIWGSEAHVATVERAYKEICADCTAAVII
jgi:radical SAM protein with 4Fe4S-binding SPASM domain